jgi:hypothetical protein
LWPARSRPAADADDAAACAIRANAIDDGCFWPMVLKKSALKIW